MTSDTGSPFFVMELIFFTRRRVVGRAWMLAVDARAVLRAVAAETERRARAEARHRECPNSRSRVSELQIINTDLQAEKRVLAEAQARLLESFQALSAQALQANNQMFLDLADTALAKRQMAIDELVRPLKDSLTKVDAKMQELETARVSAYSMLTSQLQSLGTETTNLVKALRTPHTRGQWGEMQLRRAVEMAGMVDYCDFRVQQTLYGEDGRLRPDLVVMLPNGRRLVVDSKAPLAAYLDAIELEDDGMRAAKLKQHAIAGSRHT